MRQNTEWTEQSLLSLPPGEHDWIEAKGRRGADLTCPGVDENDIRMLLSKAISAFANSGGGALVLGMKSSDSGWKVDDGGVSVVVKQPSTKEWLEDLVPYLVDPRLRTFNVITIGRGSDQSTIAAGKAVYIIEIGDSQSAPHQAVDNRYYGRVAGKSRPLSHQFVLDILGRRQLPAIALSFSITARMEGQRRLFFLSASGGVEENREPNRKVSLNCEALNNGKVLANFVSCHVRLPASMVEHDSDRRQRTLEIDGVAYVEWVRKNTRRDVTRYEVTGTTQYGPSWFDPILPQLAYTWDWDIASDFRPAGFTGVKIFWTAFADNAPPQNGQATIEDIPFADGS